MIQCNSQSISAIKVSINWAFIQTPACRAEKNEHYVEDRTELTLFIKHFQVCQLLIQPLALKCCRVIADIDPMERSPKKHRLKMKDCRECSYFGWDFELGRFLCESAKDCQVEDLHLIPDWCPLTNIGPAAISTKDKTHKTNK
jgi:hypothetical protein